MSFESNRNVTPLVASVIISLAVAGYFTGLQSPMNPSDLRSTSPIKVTANRVEHLDDDVIPATPYAEMGTVTGRRVPQTQLANLRSNAHSLAEIKIQPGEKMVALVEREQNRAFNGAPPTIPHPVEQRADASCIACHDKSVKTASLRIPRMSHRFLTNCSQCHVESQPTHMTAIVFRENNFNGLPAPQNGPRAFNGAPPQIPHSTWMRTNCMSCHGYAGLQGLRTTHPWRQNCQQCHTSSAALEQTLVAAEANFLPGPNTEQSDYP